MLNIMFKTLLGHLLFCNLFFFFINFSKVLLLKKKILFDYKELSMDILIMKK